MRERFWVMWTNCCTPALSRTPSETLTNPKPIGVSLGNHMKGNVQTKEWKNTHTDNKFNTKASEKHSNRRSVCSL